MHIKLVTFQNPIFQTIQGEGILVGTPSVFIRLYGCNDSCEWCDTKGSWKEGSTFSELAVLRVAEMAKTYNCPHYVITGGNPLLQGDAVYALMHALSDSGHITVETQASLYHAGVSRDADLLSLSPKLHAWPTEALAKFLGDSRVGRQVQIKVVVQGAEDTRNALSKFCEILSEMEYAPVCILQPESSLGRKNVQCVIAELEAWQAHAPRKYSENVRIIPQLHRTSLYVI